MSGNNNSQAVPWGMDQTALRAFGQNPFDFLIPDRSTDQEQSWRWATVTASNPLKIRLDGDTQPLAASPNDMGGPRFVGDRVYAQIVGRRVMVFGPNGGAARGATSTSSSTSGQKVWHRLTMGSQVAAYATDTNPAWKRSGDIIQIAGAVTPKDSAAASDLNGTTGIMVCTLPSDIRPTSQKDLGPYYGAGSVRFQGSGENSWFLRIASSLDSLYACRYGPDAPSATAWLPFSVMYML